MLEDRDTKLRWLASLGEYQRLLEKRLLVLKRQQALLESGAEIAGRLKRVVERQLAALEKKMLQHRRNSKVTAVWRCNLAIQRRYS